MSVTATPFAHVLIALAAVGGLVIMIALVLLADRQPYFKNSHPDSSPGKVRGGVHTGDPRSQAPPEWERADVQPGQPAAPPEAAGAQRETAGAGSPGS